MNQDRFKDVIARCARFFGTFRGITLLLTLTGLAIFLHLLGIARYGFFRDELYYIACGEHLAWGYVDQPPLIALIAWIARHAIGDSLAAFRILPILAGGGTVFLTGWLAAELGGGRLAQSIAAMAILFAPLYLALDSILTMNAFEPVFWLGCACVAARIAKGGSPKLWLLFGAIAGIGMENKHTLAVFGFAIVAGLLLSGKLDVFRSRWIWIGGLVALALAFPNLLWEAHNGWPQIEVVRNAQQLKNTPIGVLEFLFEQVLFYHPVMPPLWLAGLGWLLFRRNTKDFRFLGWSYLIVMGVFIVAGGKSYYPMPVYPVLMAAGGAAFEEFCERTEWRALAAGYPATIVLAGLFTLPYGVPLLPVETFLKYSDAIPYGRNVKMERDSAARLPQNYGDMFGWDRIALTVAHVYHGLPAADQRTCAILAGNYGEAGAIDHYGPMLGLPKSISGHNSYFYWGTHGYTGQCVILVGESSGQFKNYFMQADLVATFSNPLAMPSEQRIAIYVCHRPRAPLAELWPHFKVII
jgi:hypothetical protein